MKTKDYLMVTLAPLPLLLIPLVGIMVSSEWKWTWRDFVAAWGILAFATFAYRLLATRQWSNLSYKLGAGLAVLAGFLVTWINLAVQIIGDENPAFVLYFVALLPGLAGAVLSRLHPAGLARAAFATAAAIFLIPIVAVLCWPTDFSPGVPQVFALNFVFVLLFAGAGLLFQRAGTAQFGSS